MKRLSSSQLHKILSDLVASQTYREIGNSQTLLQKSFVNACS